MKAVKSRQVAVRLTADLLERLKRQADRLSVETQLDVRLSAVIRLCLVDGLERLERQAGHVVQDDGLVSRPKIPFFDLRERNFRTKRGAP